MRIGIERRVPGRAARRAGRARPRLYFPLSLSFVIILLFLCQARKGNRRLEGPGITHSGWGWDSVILGGDSNRCYPRRQRPLPWPFGPHAAR